MRKWRIEDSEELYNINGWGTSYFSINEKGHVVVTPRKDDVAVDLKELVDELQLRDVTAPMLVRFPDILDNRIEKISSCFKQASEEYGYKGEKRVWLQGRELYGLSYQGKPDETCGGRNHQPWQEVQFGAGGWFEA